MVFTLSLLLSFHLCEQPPPLRRDLEELRDDIDDDEYDETRKDTMEQLTVCCSVQQLAALLVTAASGAGAFMSPSRFPKLRSCRLFHVCMLLLRAPRAFMQEFQEKLERMMAGDMTLVSELGQVKLALTAAIKDAFKTPEVIAMFAKREPAALRTRLAHLQEEHKLGRLPAGRFKSQAIEIIVALRKLGEKVSDNESSPVSSDRCADSVEDMR